MIWCSTLSPAATRPGRPARIKGANGLPSSAIGNTWRLAVTVSSRGSQGYKSKRGERKTGATGTLRRRCLILNDGGGGISQMPKRTNDFQQLVHMIQLAFAPTGAKVTESVLDHTREIDVLIEAPVGPYHVKIAVEAKDQKRPLDVSVIEEMVGCTSQPVAFQLIKSLSLQGVALQRGQLRGQRKSTSSSLFWMRLHSPTGPSLSPRK
jgi:hypothetical protein